MKHDEKSLGAQSATAVESAGNVQVGQLSHAVPSYIQSAIEASILKGRAEGVKKRLRCNNLSWVNRTPCHQRDDMQAHLCGPCSAYVLITELAERL